MNWFKVKGLVSPATRREYRRVREMEDSVVLMSGVRVVEKRVERRWSGAILSYVITPGRQIQGDPL